MEKEAKFEYEAPTLTEIGSFEEITQANARGARTDVPLNTPGPNVFS